MDATILIVVIGILLRLRNRAKKENSDEESVASIPTHTISIYRGL